MITQQRTFYIKFKQSENILSNYFGYGTLYVDFEINWDVNEFNILYVDSSSFINIWIRLLDETEKTFIFDELPENIKDTLKIALKNISNEINPHSLNEPKLCRQFSEI